MTHNKELISTLQCKIFREDWLIQLLAWARSHQEMSFLCCQLLLRISWGTLLTSWLITRREKFLIMIKYIISEKTKIQRLMGNQMKKTKRKLFKRIPLTNKAVAAMKKMERKRKSIFTIMDSMMKKEITILWLETILPIGMRLSSSWEKGLLGQL